MSLGGFRLHPLVASLRTTGVGLRASQSALPDWPFITISRQTGTLSAAFGQTLTGALNAHDHSGHPWQWLDRELVERIAADHHLSADLVASLETSSHTWISEFFGGLSHTDNGTPSELALFRRVVETMRALARAGHVVLVGLSGVLIARDMPRGLHIRIIAPFEWRASRVAEADHISERQARSRVKLLDNDRDAFFAKFWPGKPLSAELFQLTLNASLLTESQMASCIASLAEKDANPSRDREGAMAAH